MKKLLLYIDSEVLDQVRKIAKKEDRSTNAQIRVLIRKGLQK